MIGATIGSFILLGVLTTFLMLGRSGANIIAYTTMDAQTRKGFEEFAQDVRMASDCVWNSATSLTLTVPNNYTSTSNQVTYAWDNTSGSATYRYFYRVPGSSATGTPKTTYIANVTSFTFYGYDRLNASTTTNAAIKRVQINLTVTTSNKTVVSATDTTLSASFVLRNKVST
jgi:hypothetical protein